MGYQNFNQMHAPGLQAGLPGQLPAYGGSNGMLPGAQGLPGVPAATQALVNQQLQNPHAGDGFATQGGTAGANAGQPPANPMSELMPDPVSMAAGGAVAWGAAYGLEKLEKHGKINDLAEKIDRAPGISKVSDWLGKHEGIKKPEWVKELLLDDAKGGGSADDAIKALQKRQLEISREALKKVDNPYVQNALNELKSTNSFDDVIKALSDKENGALKSVFDEIKANASTKEAKKATKILNGLNQQTKGLKQHYLSYVGDKAKIVAELSSREVGPIGRTLATSIYGFKRIFTGGAATGFMSTGGGRMAAFMKNAGPIFAGVFTIGQAFSQAKKAKEGEKVSTFFHNFLGAGVGMFLGWELGRQLLHAGGVRRFMGKFASRGMLMFFKKVTWGGFILEMASMFGVSMLFQKAFEKISHKIFGKPSEESLGNRQSPPAPGVAGTAMNQVRQQIRPTTGQQPRLSGYPAQGGARVPNYRPAAGNDSQLNVPLEVFRRSVASARNQADLDRIAQQMRQPPSNSLAPAGNFGA